ncbi:YggS family pyridoxal phosphate-dependent enzyme [Bacillus andreraoultii]|uniref:YggS family pyridoxal phosphate-dependent enzyme n=1 Tax=Bacillus andreraoultii TaxID=1499685 RepID=UPI0005397DDE|nr:YggS family pyridoxal phosphate-dependent enzyme [Bacillus andreraoultii]
MNSIKGNYERLNEKLTKACQKSNRRREDITVIAVTKYVSVERANEAIELGIRNLGENRDQEFLKKYEVLGNRAKWHFIGTLQTRKVKNIIDKIEYIHSLDRLSLAKEINKRAGRTISCFVQVNVSGENSKHGLRPDEVIPFIEQLKDYPNIKVVGLMTMAPHIDDETVLRNCFRSLKRLQKEVQQLQLPYAPCTELSMGMSNDFEIAVEEGATYIRIGSALVGE